MKAERHEMFQQIIDNTLAGGVSPQEEKSLREHLIVCAPCREYLNSTTRIIAGLGGFSFDVNPELHAKVCASLKLRAQQLEARQPSRRRLAWGCIIALVLTAVSSFADLQFGCLLATLLHLQPMQVQRGLLAFWIMPSLPLLLLFPMLSMLSTSRTNLKGGIL